MYDREEIYLSKEIIKTNILAILHLVTVHLKQIIFGFCDPEFSVETCLHTRVFKPDKKFLPGRKQEL